MVIFNSYVCLPEGMIISIQLTGGFIFQRFHWEMHKIMGMEPPNGDGPVRLYGKALPLPNLKHPQDSTKNHWELCHVVPRKMAGYGYLSQRYGK